MNHARRDAEWLAFNRPVPASYDAINPNHYKGDREFEPIDVIEDWQLNYHLGNALKYIARNGRKPGEDPRQGLSKAIWYLERLQDKYAEEAAQKKDAQEMLDQDEVEFLAIGERFANIPQSVIPGSDEDIPFTFTYDERYINAAGLATTNHDDVILFEEWQDDDPWKHLADH